MPEDFVKLPELRQKRQGRREERENNWEDGGRGRRGIKRGKGALKDGNKKHMEEANDKHFM